MMTILRLCAEFFMTGLFAVGGGLATLPFLYEIGEKTGWYTDTDVLDMLAISESTPGPIGVNMATYAGFGVSGVLGGICGNLWYSAARLHRPDYGGGTGGGLEGLLPSGAWVREPLEYALCRHRLQGFDPCGGDRPGDDLLEEGKPHPADRSLCGGGCDIQLINKNIGAPFWSTEFFIE